MEFSEATRERPFGPVPFHICSGPVRPGASGGDVDLNGHSQIVRGETGPSAVQRYRLAWIAHHCDTHEAAVADDPACRIEIDPAGAGQIDLDPGVRVSTAGIAVVVGSGTCKYPETKRAAIPSERTASIMSIARSRQLPLPILRVRSGC